VLPLILEILSNAFSIGVMFSLKRISEDENATISFAASILPDVPVAAISLVDENRQWFKSIRGADITETPRCFAFCAHAILEEGTFIIPDTLADPRFADNPLVTHPPYVRFYAGQPLKMVDNIHVGTLCVYDTKPREISSDDIQFLQDLSVTVTNELKASMIKSFFG
jgi:GAF domain-containing protein